MWWFWLSGNVLRIFLESDLFTTVEGVNSLLYISISNGRKNHLSISPSETLQMQVFPVAAEALRECSLHERCFWESGERRILGSLESPFSFWPPHQKIGVLKCGLCRAIAEALRPRGRRCVHLCLLPWVIRSGGVGGWGGCPVAILG